MYAIVSGMQPKTLVSLSDAGDNLAEDRSMVDPDPATPATVASASFRADENRPRSAFIAWRRRHLL